MPRLLTWRTLSGSPLFSSKRAVRGPGVIENRGYMFHRWVQEDGGSVPSNVAPKRTEIEHISKQSRGEGGRGETAAIPTRTRRHFPIVCADFCYLSKHTESQVAGGGVGLLRTSTATSVETGGVGGPAREYRRGRAINHVIRLHAMRNLWKFPI